MIVTKLILTDLTVTADSKRADSNMPYLTELTVTYLIVTDITDTLYKGYN